MGKKQISRPLARQKAAKNPPSVGTKEKNQRTQRRKTTHQRKIASIPKQHNKARQRTRGSASTHIQYTRLKLARLQVQTAQRGNQGSPSVVRRSKREQVELLSVTYNQQLHVK